MGADAVANATYVGGAACAACHESETAAWAGSHHDLAMQVANEETVLGDFGDASFSRYGVTSTFYRQGDRFMVRTEGPQGELVDYPIEYTFGVTPLQQYLIPFPGGRYQVLSIAWDSRPEGEGGQRWFHLYPDEPIRSDDPLHWTQRSQNWNYMCAECHSTHVMKGYELASQSYETTWSDVDVSCEACHGPGSAHIELAERLAARAVGDGPDDWRLTAPLSDPGRSWAFGTGAPIASRTEPRRSEAEIDTCAHCHARRATIAEGRIAGSGLHDSDVVSLLREGLYHADGQILDEVYVYGSFVQSKMYEAGVTCSDCHEPHGLQLRAEGNALCAGCHAVADFDSPGHHFHESGSAGAQCVECHMPASTYMVVDPRRDHSFRIPQPHLSRSIEVPNACNGCHADESVEWAVEAVERWYGAPENDHYGQAIHAGRTGVPGAGPALGRLAADTTQPVMARASALDLLGGYLSGSTMDALEAGLVDEEPLVRLGALSAAAAWPPATILSLVYPLLQDPARAVRIEAARLLATAPRTSLSAQQAAEIDVAVLEYERAQLVNLDHPSTSVNLGNLYALRGQLDAGETAYRTALAIDADYLPAYLNLADLYRLAGRDDQGELVLREGLDRAPESPELHHAMGLLITRRGDLPGALQWLERAAGARPENPRFAYVYGVALGSNSQTGEAMRVFEEALEQHPYDREILTALATFSRDAGAFDAAIGYAGRLVEILPEDQGVRQLLTQLRESRR